MSRRSRDCTTLIPSFSRTDKRFILTNSIANSLCSSAKMNIMNPSAKRTPWKLSNMSLFLPQKDVAEGAAHCGPADSSVQITRPAANTDSRKGNGDTSGSPHPRPTALVVKNELLAKNMRKENYDDRSLPCTPEFLSDSELVLSGCSAEHEELESVTRQLLSDFYNVFTGTSQSNWRKKPALTTMKRVVESLLEKHRYVYNGMRNGLSLEDGGNDLTFISVVAKNIFEDGTTNWGRIASLIASGAVVCQYLKANGRENCVERVSQEISSYLLSDQREWLVRHNAWDGFVNFFRVEDPESTVRNALMAVAGLAGIGATLVMLIR